MSALGAAALGVGSIANAFMQNRAARKSRNAINAGIDSSLAENKRQFNKSMQLIAPYQKAGESSLSDISDIMGWNGDDARTSAMDRFREDPGYQYMIDSSNKALERSALKRGDLFSGNFATALADLNQNLADQSFGNYYNRLWNTANLGRGAVSGATALRSNYANTVSDLYGQRGRAVSDYYNNQANAIGNMLSSVTGNANEYLTQTKGLDLMKSIYGTR